MKLHGVTAEGLIVKDIQLIGQNMIAELGTYQITGLQERAPAHIPGVVLEVDIVTKGTSRLLRLVVAPEGGTGRYADKSVKPDSVLHHYIGNAGREQCPQATSF